MGERIAVIGLGYVGLPLAIALARKFDTIGFDIDARRIDQLKRDEDHTGEIASGDLASSSLRLTTNGAELAGAEIFVITVPTPIDRANRPDFRAVLSACQIVGEVMRQGAIVVFESTVYPGATEEICGPALERASGLKCGVEFKLGYSPERINPGDKEHSIERIVKVVAGQDDDTAARLAGVYGAIIEAGIHRAPSIKVAEAAKVIENTQRDVNIALMNEISKICDLVGIRSADVLAAARTKWNFLNFHPGLVGGHCIGVDPYYLTAKAEELGYRPEVILSGRRINDSMGAYVAQRLIKMLAAHELPLKQMRVGILGLTFKENVPDIRNSKVLDIILELKSYGVNPWVHDPYLEQVQVAREYGIKLSGRDELEGLHAVIMAVPHNEFRSWSHRDFAQMLQPGSIFIDIRATFDRTVLGSDIRYWSL